MKITDKPNYRLLWDKDGVQVIISTHLYMIDEDHLYNPPGMGDLPRNTSLEGVPAPVPLNIQVSGIDSPKVVIHDDVLQHIPHAIEGIKAWMDKVFIIQKWGQEVAIYKQVMQNVMLPGVIPTWGQRRVFYSLTIEMHRDHDVEELRDIPDLQVHITIDQERASYQLEIPTGKDDEYGIPLTCTISRGPLTLPITMDSLKATLRIPFQHYLTYL